MDATQHVATKTFRDGHSIPQFGLGVWQLPDSETAPLVGAAIKRGYRHIDTARIYDNERGVGAAIQASTIPRDDLFITTKLWNEDQGFDATLRAFDDSMQRLGLDTLDLYLIHWPSPSRGLYIDSWRALVALQREGRVRSIGVSNFHVEHLEWIIDATGVVPVINQIELHPYFQQRELRSFHETHGIVTQDWSPLGQGGELLADPVIESIAERVDATPAQVVIAWHLALGHVVIPKTANVHRLAENLAGTQVTLTKADVDAINALDRHDGRIGPDPERASF